MKVGRPLAFSVGSDRQGSFGRRRQLDLPLRSLADLARVFAQQAVGGLELAARGQRPVLRILGHAIELPQRLVQSIQPRRLGALEMLFLEGHHEMEIASIVEPLYLEAGEFEKLHKIYQVHLGKLTDPSDRVAMYQRLAELAEEKLLDPGRASTWWGEALCEDASSNLAAEQVERLARETGGWSDLVNVYVRVLERHTAADLQRRWPCVARVLWGWRRPRGAGGTGQKRKSSSRPKVRGRIGTATVCTGVPLTSLLISSTDDQPSSPVTLLT